MAIPKDLAYYYGLENFETKVHTDEEDSVTWSAKHFIGLAVKGNTQMLEMLFSPAHCQELCHPAFKRWVLDNRKEFMSKVIFNSIWGYAYSEHQKALGLSSRDLGERRKEDLSAFGYSLRNATHCIRLMYSGAEAMNTGEFPVRLPEPVRRVCMAIKTGHVTKYEYLDFYDEYKARLEHAGETTTLPDKYDRTRLNQILVGLHTDVLSTI